MHFPDQKYARTPGHYKCVKCYKVKPVVEFNPRAKGGPRGADVLWCKECLATHARRVAVPEASGKQFKSKRDLVYCMKNRPCTDCGFQFHATVMEFDHVRGEKRFNLSAPTGRPYQEVLDEIAKCEVVCANCHRVRTANRGIHDPARKVSFRPICSFAGKVIFS